MRLGIRRQSLIPDPQCLRSAAVSVATGERRAVDADLVEQFAAQNSR